MTTLREAAQQALEALEADCGGRCNAEYNPCWQREVAETLRAALAEPTPSQQLAAAGFTRRDTRLECDECGGKFTRQMLPIHKCKPVQEPVAQLHPDHFKPNPDGTEWCREVLLYSPNNEGDKLSGVNTRVKLYTSPPQRKPLTEEEIEVLALKHAPPVHPDFFENDDWLAFARAIERAHGIGGSDD